MLKDVSDSADLDAEILLCEVLQKPRSFLFARPEYLLSLTQKQKAGVFLQQRLLGNPIAYIVKKKEFFGIDFFVNNSTLVPRPETEILVEKACEFFQHGGTLLDIGTGSGCIPIAIAKNSHVENIFACDICEHALEVAKKNAKKHEVNITFFQSDLLTNIPNTIFLEEKNSPCPSTHYAGKREQYAPFIITANLPYVPENETHKSIQKEPKTAIYSGEDGLHHYRNLFSQLSGKNFDILFFEFHPPQASILEKMCKKNFSQHTFKTLLDLSGKERIGILQRSSCFRDKEKKKRQYVKKYSQKNGDCS